MIIQVDDNMPALSRLKTRSSIPDGKVVVAKALALLDLLLELTEQGDVFTCTHADGTTEPINIRKWLKEGRPKNET